MCANQCDRLRSLCDASHVGPLGGGPVRAAVARGRARKPPPGREAQPAGVGTAILLCMNVACSAQQSPCCIRTNLHSSRAGRLVALAVDMQQALAVQLDHHREVGVVRVQLNPTLRRQLILHATCKRSQLRKSTRTSMVCKSVIEPKPLTPPQPPCLAPSLSDRL